MQHLAIDNGGSNLRIGLVTETGLTDVKLYECAHFSGPQAILEQYKADAGLTELPGQTVFAAAGPVNDKDNFKFTNISNWSVINFSEVENNLGTKITLINDFVAQCYAPLSMNTSDFVFYDDENFSIDLSFSSQNPILPNPNNSYTIIGPGTGLGVATLTELNFKFHSLPGEGGHGDFPVIFNRPDTEREIEIIKIFSQKNGHPTYEDLCSGPGLLKTFNAIRNLSCEGDLNLSPSDVTDMAREGDETALEAVSMFTKSCARAAKNNTLVDLTLSGVVITGGIIPKLGDLFDYKLFRAQFNDQASYGELLEKTPIVRIKDTDYAGLEGAANYARREIGFG